jgi:hypothetical protein
MDSFTSGHPDRLITSLDKATQQQSGQRKSTTISREAAANKRRTSTEQHHISSFSTITSITFTTTTTATEDSTNSSSIPAHELMSATNHDRIQRLLAAKSSIKEALHQHKDELAAMRECTLPALELILTPANNITSTHAAPAGWVEGTPLIAAAIANRLRCDSKPITKRLRSTSEVVPWR